LASCGTDKKIKIFDCRSQRLLQHYDAHDDSVNSIAFNNAGTSLISSSNDSTIKIWDLRKGCILYTLYGHEGATTSANFSTNGDYFVTGGADSVVLCWESNMNPFKTEQLDIKAKIETELFVTEKEKVEKLPTTRGTKLAKSPKRVSLM
jgi:centriolar protein POC1